MTTEQNPEPRPTDEPATPAPAEATQQLPAQTPPPAATPAPAAAAPAHPAATPHPAEAAQPAHVLLTVGAPAAEVPSGARPAGTSSYTNPYGLKPSPPQEHKRRNRTWVPVVSAAAIAAVLASAGTAGLLAATGDDPSGVSLSNLDATQQESAPVRSSTVTNPDWPTVTAAVAPSVVAIQVASSSGGAEGSGVILDAEGHVLTNNHVVAGATDGKVQVTLSDGRLFDATIVGTDATSDLAVVQLDDAPDDLQPATFGDSDAVEVGEAVLAVGNPLGLANTATTGIVSALDRPVTASGEDGSDQVVTNAIQIDAAINPGNSGGPLFNASGEVIGITSSIATLSSGLSSPTGSIGLGFAIPAALATSVSDQLIADGTAEHAFLGVALSDGTATADGVTRRGAQVEEVTDGSPASGAGIRPGDVIVAIDGDAVNGAESLTAFVRERAAGDDATITLVRDGKATQVDVTLAVREETPAPAPEDQGSGSDQGDSQDGSSDPTQPNNLPEWLQDLLGQG